MACTATTAGRALPCSDSLGGIKQLWLTNYVDGMFTAPTAGGVGHTGTTTYLSYVPNRNSSSFTQTINASRENGTVFYTQVVTAVFSKLDATELADFQQLLQKRIAIIVEDNNGNKMVCGVGHGCQGQGGSVTTGTASADLNGFTFEFVAEELLPAQFYDSADDSGTPTFTPAT